MASSQRGALFGAAPYRSREGLNTRPVSNSNEVQVQIDPMHADLDEEIVGLHRKVKQLRNVAQEIESEAKYQNDFIAQLQMTLIKAQAGVKNNVRRLNMSIIQQGSNNVLHVVLFSLLLFFILYLLSKFFRR
ncbi:bet1-like protein At4g14600 [Telopea speciosissima]|uniref:bet1-like protein At4g14600 n=1 Tax=Telopea speciosissima TaxID=54955 RepID=UPI001CC4546A|nr:bet1-like protein At4g14600 [Telopea speciosissima]